MSNIYVRSTDGSDVDDGSTWALAKAGLAGAAAIDAAGDTIFVSQNHAETTAGNVSIALAGTIASPVKIICGNDAAEPPTAVADTATVTTTGTGYISITGSAYVYGVTFVAGTGSSSGPGISMSGNTHLGVFEKCAFKLVNTHSGTNVRLGVSTSGAHYRGHWKDCDIKFAAAAQSIVVDSTRFDWDGGSVLAGSATPTALIGFGGATGNGPTTVSGVDLSNLGTTFNIFASSLVPTKGVIRNCKLPAGWTGGLGVTGTPATRYEMHNCDSGDTNYQMWVEDYAGSIKSETTIVRTGGSSDGTTPLSWKMASNANAEYPTVVLDSPEIAKWNETVGTPITATVEVITDGVTLTDADCWLEVQYPGTSGFPLSLFANDAPADVLATPANQTTSTAAWTTTGLTTPVKQKLEVTFTPQEKGVLSAVVRLAKASTTVYVDRKLA